MSLCTSKPDLSSKRRRFQPPITTFFSTSSHPSSNASSLSHNHYSAPTHSPTPVVETKVQASLLSVGMRVRKSVAEGYKTNHAKNMDEKHTITTITKFAHQERTAASVQPSTYSTTMRSELAPFSGMDRSSQYTLSLPYPGTSTLHTQQEHTITTDEGDTFSLPPSSQESIDSQSFSTPPPMLKKRTHTDFDFEPYEDDEDIDLGFDEMNNEWQDPLRLNPFHHGARPSAGANLHGRTILSPTLNQQRRRFLGVKHNKPVGGNPMDVDDFEEPAFLRRREDVEMEVVDEVQMGGVEM
ncbi:ribonucleotide reductase inhibitor-domain-containing protein [Aspergillus carlsbadensis]|nr:ribonucleotide reductase inhibitor-domain-containing protein [Aspergillus carlsbadensis]